MKHDDLAFDRSTCGARWNELVGGGRRSGRRRLTSGAKANQTRKARKNDIHEKWKELRVKVRRRGKEMRRSLDS